MINLRYHIISLTAVFLALAIGMLIGTTVMEGGTVNLLERRLDDVEASVDRTRTENRELRAEIDDLRVASERLADDGVPTLVERRLAGVRLVVVTADGVPGGAVDALVDDIERADGRIVATLRITDKAALDSDDSRADLVRALALPEGLETDLESLRAAEELRMAAALFSTTPNRADALAAVESMRRSGFLDVDSDSDTLPLGPSAARPAPVYVVVGGSDVAPLDDLLLGLLRRWADDSARPRVVAVGVPVEVDEEKSDEPAPVELAAAIRDDEALRSWIASVDHGGDVLGRLAAVLAVAELVDGRGPGHYGLDDDAQRLVPPPESPR